MGYYHVDSGALYRAATTAQLRVGTPAEAWTENDVCRAAKRVTFVATDGHRLARSSRKGNYSGLGKDGVIVPSRALSAVSRTAEEAVQHGGRQLFKPHGVW